jgi:16S rRNA (guanine(966)-N(2))-methyltransferase RsmD
MDRVKAAVFSSLGDLVPGASVLDLFAGSGAMGIEALSRGASRAVLVDSSERCTRCIRDNLRSAACEASVQTMDAYRFLDLYAGEAEFDLVFADPPYFKKDGETYPKYFPIEYPRKPESEVHLLGSEAKVSYEWKNGMNWIIQDWKKTGLENQPAIVFYFKCR